MTSVSHTIDELLKRKGIIEYELPRAGREERQTKKFDELFYAGELKPYEKYKKEDENEDLFGWRMRRKLAEESPELADVIQAAIGQITRYASSKNTPFEEAAKEYSQSEEGKELKTYLENKLGRVVRTPAEVKTDYLGSAVAGVGSGAKGDVLYGDINYKQKVRMLSKAYNVPEKLMEQYVFQHENVHLSQKPGTNDHIAKEYDVERTLGNFYRHMQNQNPKKAYEYRALESIARARESQIPHNYGSHQLHGWSGASHKYHNGAASMNGVCKAR